MHHDELAGQRDPSPVCSPLGLLEVTDAASGALAVPALVESQASLAPWSGESRLPGTPVPSTGAGSSLARSSGLTQPCTSAVPQQFQQFGRRVSDVRLCLKLCSGLFLYLYPVLLHPCWVLTPVCSEQLGQFQDLHFRSRPNRHGVCI